MRETIRGPWWAWLLAIVVLSVFLRSYQLGALSFVADEFLDVNSSYGYAQTGLWQAWNFNLGAPDTANVNVARDERASLYKWQVAQVFRHFAPTEAAARSVSVGWGVVTTILVYWVAAYFSRRRGVGLIAAFLYAVSVSGLEIDRKIRMYAMFVPVFLAFWWVVFRFLEEPYTGKIRFLRYAWKRSGFNFVYVVPTFLLFSMAISIHLLAVNIVAIILVYSAVMGVRRFRRTGEWRSKYVFIWAAMVLGAVSARIVLPHEFGLITASFNFPDNHYGYLSLVLEDYEHWLLAALVFGVGLWSLLCGILPGSSEMTDSGRVGSLNRSWWVAVSFLTLLFLAVFVWRRNVGAQYIAFAQPLKMIVMAWGVYTFAIVAQERITATTRRTGAIALLLLAVLLPNYGYFWQENNVYHETSSGSQPDYRSVFGYVVKSSTPGEALVTRGFRNYYWSGSGLVTYDFGGELVRTGQAEKLSLGKLQAVMATHPTGWVVLSDNDEDYVTKETRDFIAKNLERINVIQVRGPVGVYRWDAFEQSL